MRRLWRNGQRVVRTFFHRMLHDSGARDTNGGLCKAPRPTSSQRDRLYNHLVLKNFDVSHRAFIILSDVPAAVALLRKTRFAKLHLTSRALPLANLKLLILIWSCIYCSDLLYKGYYPPCYPPMLN